MPVRIIASSFAFVGFATALICGMAAGNPAGTIISRALVALLVCYAAGFVLGTVGRHAIQDHVERYKRENPVHDEDTEGEAVEEADLSNRTSAEPEARENATAADAA